MINKLKYLISLPRRLLRLKEYIQQFQPVGMAKVIQDIMGFKYDP